MLGLRVGIVDRVDDVVDHLMIADPAVIAGGLGAICDLAGFQRRIEADPADYQARFDLALGLNAKGQQQEAVDQLIEIVRRDRTWNEDGARKQLLQLFEAWGPMDPQRRSDNGRAEDFLSTARER